MDFLLLLSRVLSYGIIVGAVVVKLPQILKIVNNTSVKGLVLTSFWLETVGLTINFAYSYNSGFAFSTYGETVFILVQNIIILYLIYSYQHKIDSGFFSAMAVYAVLASVLVSGYLGIKWLAYLQGFTIPLFSISKIPQIYSNYYYKSVGQLSFITTFLQFAGSAARVFTTFKEVHDSISIFNGILLGFLSATTLNGILTTQCMLFKEKPTPTRRRVTSGKSGKKN